MNDEEQARRREELRVLLGDVPDWTRPISARLVERVKRGGYVLEKLVLDLNGIEPVPAHFVKPAGATGPLPCVLYCHAHGGAYALGKDELTAGQSALQAPPYAEALTAAGYAALCIDTWVFGERRGRAESEAFKEMLWKGQVLWGMMVYDSVRALDYLCSRPDIDPARLASAGISMGSTMSWWTAALDLRIAACVDLCCLTDFEALIESRGLDGHGLYYFVPGLLKRFSAGQINSLIAPRPHLSLQGDYDRLTPPAGLDRIDRELSAVYAARGRPDAWVLKRYPIGHFESADMRAEVLAFLKRWL